MIQELMSMAEQAMEQALKKGAEQAEVYWVDSEELSIDVSNGKVETMKQAREKGLGIRVIQHNRMGYAFTSDLTPSALANTLEKVLAVVRYTGEDRHFHLPQKPHKYPQVDTFDKQLAKIPVENKIQLAKEVEASARSADPRIKITERAAYQDAQYTVGIVNSQGINASYSGSYCGVYALLVAEEGGESQTGFAMKYAKAFTDIEPQSVGVKAARKAVRMLGAGTIESGRIPVVLDPYVATQFLGVLTPSLSAESVQKGKSLFKGQIGRPVAAPLVSLVDDGTLAGGILSAPFDGEGVAAQRTQLIKDGSLQGFLYNTYTARKDGAASTGNGNRGSYKGTPEISATNIFFLPGKESPEQMLEGIDYGLYLTELMGVHTANPISGDFSLGAAGILIEKGQLTQAVRGFAVAGNLRDLLRNVEGVANDLTFFVGKGSPTIRLSHLAISG